MADSMNNINSYQSLEEETQEVRDNKRNIREKLRDYLGNLHGVIWMTVFGFILIIVGLVIHFKYYLPEERQYNAYRETTCQLSTNVSLSFNEGKASVSVDATCSPWVNVTVFTCNNPETFLSCVAYNMDKFAAQPTWPCWYNPTDCQEMPRTELWNLHNSTAFIFYMILVIVGAMNAGTGVLCLFEEFIEREKEINRIIG